MASERTVPLAAAQGGEGRTAGNVGSARKEVTRLFLALSPLKQGFALDIMREGLRRSRAPSLCRREHGHDASNLFDCTDRGLYDFAVHHLEEMLDDLKARYYALDFQP
jgi:hypothetical protein